MNKGTHPTGELKIKLSKKKLLKATVKLKAAYNKYYKKPIITKKND